ncbi:MAG: VWA domain-containing protein [Clostridia bacterium]|nr:VWA domain-containing protein [Clostridia bacterium]
MRTDAGLVPEEGEEPVAMTRFEAAKTAIRERIDRAIDGSIFTLVYAGDNTAVIYERTEDKEQALLLLDELQPAYNTLDLTDAIGIAQGYFNENTSLKTVLVTDSDYDTAHNIEVVNIANKVDNYSLSGITHTHLGDTLTVTGLLNSFESDRDLTLSLYLDGAENSTETKIIHVKAGEPTPFSLSAETKSFSSVKIRIAETDAQPLDNEFIIHNVTSENSYNTLLVSERPFFLESVLRSQLDANIDVMTPEEYDGRVGYGLYVFDTVVPLDMTLPTDGTVWMVNVNGNVEGAGYTVQGDVSLAKAELLTPSTSSSSATQTLLEGMNGKEIYITRYVKCGFYRNFTTLLSYKGSPVVFAGVTEFGNREAVIAFDLHDSNLPLLYDYTVLIRNLLAFSFPDMIDRTTYECGELATVNVITNCESIRVETPSGDVTYLDTDGASDSFRLTEVGIYTVNMTVSGSAREFYIWSAMKEAECDPTVTLDAVALQGEATSGGFDGKFDPMWIIFITLLVIFLADWMVYCYEKYQLR